MLGTRLISGTCALVVVLALHACGPREDRGAAEPQGGDTSGAETGGAGETGGGETGGGDTSGEGASSEPELVMSDDACTTDADCAPADCCHASACVAVANAPSCGDAMCTMECRFGTIDCGGGCLCHEGRCAARLMPAPDLQVQPGGESGAGATAPQ